MDVPLRISVAVKCIPGYFTKKAIMTKFLSASVLCLALTASTSQAFVGPQYSQPRNVATRWVPSSITGSHTALHMNLFDRFTRVAKSNLNNILQSLEDPEKIMTQVQT